MSSVKREYSLPASAVADAVDVSGNGPNNRAVFYIDVRKSSVFRVDNSDITRDRNIVFDTFPGAPGAVAGKEITLLIFHYADNSSFDINLTGHFGPRYESNSNSYVGSINNTDSKLAAVKLISDGTNFYPVNALIW